MNVLIAYASKTGTTEKCAKILKALVDDATLCNLAKEKPALNEYNFIIIGGSIRMGKLHKSAKEFITKNKDTLMDKKTAYFICNCFPDNVEDIIQKNIPADLLKKAIVASSFGGEIDPTKQKGMDKLITKIVAKSGKKTAEDTSGAKSLSTRFQISSEAINKFSEKIK
ncbi:MAG: flavodoxin domain-containing protein [Anaerovoracaceae bacterium]